MSRFAIGSYVLVVVVAGELSHVAAAGPSEKAEKLFQVRVLPLLKEKCYACHGENEKERQAKFDLRTRQGMLAGGESGEPALVPGKPETSPLYLAVARESKTWTAMPPKANDKLTREQVAFIRQWIEAGAPWPDEIRMRELSKLPDPWDSTEGETVVTSGGVSKEWTNRKYPSEQLWAYRPLKKPAPPSGRNPIDAFIDARLVAGGLSPAPPADRRMLLRRATFDLLGLPPLPDEIEAFVKDPASDEFAFAAVVDRLLASPHYGEQQARHWLDVARYGDSSGYANDYARGPAWRYRDYVVRAFNSDKRYDRFIREQIAGDEISPDDPEALVAVGFLRMGPWELTGMEVPRIARQRFLDDVTDSVGQVFLGHMLQCARCHDHKFDPVPTRDYYRLQAVFASTQFADRPAAFLATENVSGFGEQKYLEARGTHYQAILRKLQTKTDAAARKWAADRGFDYVHRAKGLREGVPEEKLAPKLIGLDVADLGLERIARKGLERLEWEFDRYRPVAMSVYDGATPGAKSVNSPPRLPAKSAGEVDEQFILAGGDPFSPKEKVSPGVLSAACQLKDQAEFDVPEATEGRRRALAEWIASPRNPLTARVMVNRIWQWHFGQALAGNPNNFGATGKRPTHPELLDWLAATFIERGWSVKEMHRLIMSSAAYRRSVGHGDATSYAAFQPRRLAAEELRDAMLRVSGELNPALGGIPVRPEMNREAAYQPRQVMGTFAEAWQPSRRPEERHRRSLYALRVRGQRDPLLEVFGAPGSDTSCEARESSLITPQVFSLFHGEAAHGRALAFAARLQKETRSREATIVQAFQLAFGREPAAAEVALCLKHWDAMTVRHRGIELVRAEYPREILREAVEENSGEKFTFREPLESAADFMPDLAWSDASPELRGLAEVCLVLFNANEFIYVY